MIATATFTAAMVTLGALGAWAGIGHARMVENGERPPSQGWAS